MRLLGVGAALLETQYDHVSRTDNQRADQESEPHCPRTNAISRILMHHYPQPAQRCKFPERDTGKQAETHA